MAKIKLSDYVMKFLADRGADTVFTLPGGGAMHLVDSLGREKRLKAAGYLHEQAAAIAADAYAQYSGKTGIVLVTTGPGSTNALTGTAASWIDSTPVLVMSGQAKRSDIAGTGGPRQKGVQEVDIVSMAKGITKYAITVMQPEMIRYHLEKALYLAEHGRKGPVWLDIPLDVQGAVIDKESLKGYNPQEENSGEPQKEDSSYITDAKKSAESAAELLKKSRRPVILAGNGIRMAGALPEFLQLSEKLKIPVLTTWRSADFFDENDPVYYGRPGSMASRDANFIQQNCDFILVIGARLDLPQVGHNYGLFARAAKKIIVEADSKEMDKLSMPIDVKAVCDAGCFIREFAKTAAAPECKEWLEYCNKMKAKYRGKLGYLPKILGRINTYSFVDILSEEMAKDDVFVPGSSGSCAEITMQAFRVKKGQRIFNTPGLGSMGFGLPASSGAAIASGKRVITVIGDGGLQHNIQTFETIRRMKLPVKIFILDNKGYGSIRMMQTRHFKGNYVCCDEQSGMSIPDCCEVAKAYGINAFRVKSGDNLREAVKKALSAPGPVLCALEVEPWLETAPRTSSYVKPDGSIVSRPLEDLWPFLDREEFLEDMIIPPVEE
ncbi:MAG: thiamine pyrophosphate-binding protein [Elusimicrobiales bacterium]|nr:thiamine pyrophosphate-binding protein [Elusimicrobiales bacterium]